MTRRILATLFIAAAAFVLLARADEPKAKADKKAADSATLDPKASIDDLKGQQGRMQALFADFKGALLRVSQRMAASPKPEDRERAKNLKLALDTANTEGLDNSFEKLVNILKQTSPGDQGAIEKAMGETEDLTKRLRAILAILMTDNRDAELKRQQQEAARRLEEIKRLIREEQTARTRTELNRGTKDQLGKEQGKIASDTDALAKGKAKGDPGGEAKAANKAGDSKGEGKPGESKSAGKNDAGDSKGDKKEGKDEGKPGTDPKKDAKGEGKGEGKKDGDPKKDAKGEQKDGGKSGADDKKGDKEDDKKSDNSPSKGEAKDSKGDSKGKADGKGEGKPSDGKGEGQPSQGKGSQSPPKDAGGSKGSGGQPPPPQDQPKKDDQPDFPGKKQIQEAYDEMKKAEEEIAKGNNDAAANKQGDAAKKLEEAKKKLEELLRQLREEEIERILAALQMRCEKMLAMQKEVREGTVGLDKVIKDRGSKTIDPADAQRGNELSDKEDAIVKEASTAIRLLEGEGSAVAFPVVLDFARELMVNVRNRLQKTDVSVTTVATEDEIIASLEEMVDALKKARKQNQSQPGQPGQGGGGSQNQPLLEEIQELKMIRNIQLRVNRMTETYGKEYKTEQAPAVEKATTPKERETAEMLKKELKGLADRQEKIYEVTKDIASGKNKVEGK